MSDDFGTINVKRGDRAREIEVMRQHYRAHRDALAKMTADAPTEHLASEYQRLIAEIDRALVKLDELESGAAVAAPPPPPPPSAPPPPSTAPPPTASARPTPASTPLARTDIPEGEPEPRSRIPLMVLGALLVLAAIAGLIWWASSERKPSDTIVEDTAATQTESTVAPATTAPDTVAASALAATPTSHDYGEIRKGTRATRQFEIANNSDQPVSLQVARSACRCLYYEHAPVIPPKAKETLTVTIDGARAKAGELRESVKITSKSDPAVATNVDVIATIR